MEKYINRAPVIKNLFDNSPHADWVIVPNSVPPGNPDTSYTHNHINFDDEATLQTIIARINTP